MLPQLIERPRLARANARIELARAIVTLGAPALAAWLVARNAGEAIFAVTALCGLIALAACCALPRERLADAAPPILSRSATARASSPPIRRCAPSPSARSSGTSPSSP